MIQSAWGAGHIGGLPPSSAAAARTRARSAAGRVFAAPPSAPFCARAAGPAAAGRARSTRRRRSSPPARTPRRPRRRQRDERVHHYDRVYPDRRCCFISRRYRASRTPENCQRALAHREPAKTGRVGSVDSGPATVSPTEASRARDRFGARSRTRAATPETNDATRAARVSLRLLGADPTGWYAPVKRRHYLPLFAALAFCSGACDTEKEDDCKALLAKENEDLASPEP